MKNGVKQRAANDSNIENVENVLKLVCYSGRDAGICLQHIQLAICHSSAKQYFFSEPLHNRFVECPWILELRPKICYPMCG